MNMAHGPCHVGVVLVGLEYEIASLYPEVFLVPAISLHLVVSASKGIFLDSPFRIVKESPLNSSAHMSFAFFTSWPFVRAGMITDRMMPANFAIGEIFMALKLRIK